MEIVICPDELKHVVICLLHSERKNEAINVEECYLKGVRQRNKVRIELLQTQH